MPMVFIRHVGANLAYVEPLGPVDPSFGQGGGADPGYDHPIFGRPGNELPGSPGHPANRPPGSWGGRPDNSLPGAPGDTLPVRPPPPGHVPPGTVLILVRDPVGVWHYAALPQANVPPPIIDNTLPTPPVTPGTPLPPTAAPKPV